MTTQFYISWMTRGHDMSRRWYTSPMKDTEAEARSLFEKKMAQQNVREAYLWKKDHYEPEELVPSVRERQPWGSDSFTQLAAYTRI